jgi:hypothetical protein
VRLANARNKKLSIGECKMKPGRSISKAGLFIAGLFFAFGLAMLIQPKELIVFHAGCNRATIFWCRGGLEDVSKEGARIYGGISILFGAAMVWLSSNRAGK